MNRRYRRKADAGAQADLFSPLRRHAAVLRDAADRRDFEAVKSIANDLENYDWGSMSMNDYMTLVTQGAFGDHYWASEPPTSLPSFYLEGTGKSRTLDESIGKLRAVGLKNWR